MVYKEEKEIESITKLYSILNPFEYSNLIKIQSNPKNSISRRFWNQSPINSEPDTTLRQNMYSSNQVYEFFNNLETTQSQEEVPIEIYHLMILDRQRGLVEEGPNKLTIAERVEFHNNDGVKEVEKPLGGVEKFRNVRIWGWLDTESEVEELRAIKTIQNGKWDIGKELVW